MGIVSVNKETKDQLRGKLLLCDLAGSERLKKSQAGKDQEKEAIEINKSLTALGEVIENYSLQESQVNAAHARFLGRHCQDADVCKLLACNIEFTRNAYVIEVRISSKENYQRCHKKVLDDVRSVKNSDVLTEGLLFRGGCHPASSGIG